MSPILAEINRILSVGHRFSTAYRPQSGVQTERSHRVLNDAMGIRMRKNDHEDWDLWLYGATFAHNVTVLQGTEGLTPGTCVSRGGGSAASPSPAPDEGELR